MMGMMKVWFELLRGSQELLSEMRGGDSSQREDVSRGLSPCAGRFSLAGAKRSREPFQTE